MPENWKPGQAILIPDPNDPSKMIELPPEALEIVAEVNSP